MTGLIIAEAAAIFLLGLLVVGLLRSHAEILRKLHELGAGLETGHDHPIALNPAPSTGGPAFDVAGVDPDDGAVAVRVIESPQPTLLAFLTSTCKSCLGLWDSLGNPEHRVILGDVRPVIITKGPAEESPSKVASLAPADVPVVMSSGAFLDYRIPGAPYFVLVGANSSRVAGEGSAATFDQLRAFMGDASADAAWDERRRRRQVNDREATVDAELRRAGIKPGDPSLHEQGNG